jgi:hypothetical protein
VAAHTFNLSYSRGGDWEVSSSRPSQAKSSQDPISTNENCVCGMHLSSQLHWKCKKLDSTPSRLGIKVRLPLFEKYKSKKGLEVWLKW